MQQSKLAGRSLATALIIYGTAHPLGGVAEPMVTHSYNLYGAPGLVEMPTAENARDAELSVSFAGVGDQTRTALSFQVAPRLSGTWRYARIPEFNKDGSDRYDRSFDIRLQFVDESKWIPAIAVGMQDFLGTGLYSAEYLVATKTFWDDVRVTAGLGWGRLGTRGEITSFGTRDYSYDGVSGGLNTGEWFNGPVAAFGGVSWSVNDKLTFKAEYSSDSYLLESERDLVDYDNPFNFGADYRFNNGVSVSAYSLYGQDFGVQLNFILNPKKPLLGPGNEPGPLPVKPRPSRSANPAAWALDWTADPADLAGIERGIEKSLAKEGIELEAISLEGRRAEVRIANNRYWAESQAVGRTARILTRALPPSVELITVTPVVDGVPNSRISFQRTDLEKLENSATDAILAKTGFADAAGPRPESMKFADAAYPETNWYLGTYLGFGFLDPDEPVRADFGMRLGGSYSPMPGLVVSGSVKYRLFGNTEDGDEGARDDDLETVRTDFRNYSAATDFFINDMTLAYFARPMPNVYSRMTAGILERMYMGVSGEVLWKPVDSRLALGAEANYVVKRDYDGGFGLQDYNTVTGHLSAYYLMDNGYHARVDVGRYLAEDFGATLALERRFDNGWKVGAYATRTNADSSDVAQGSFDKGIYFELPLRWASGQPSKSTHRMAIGELTRNSGQKVHVSDRLYERVSRHHQPVIEGNSGRFWR